jgi:hypothetical protein
MFRTSLPLMITDRIHVAKSLFQVSTIWSLALSSRVLVHDPLPLSLTGASRSVYSTLNHGFAMAMP